MEVGDSSEEGGKEVLEVHVPPPSLHLASIFELFPLGVASFS